MKDVLTFLIYQVMVINFEASIIMYTRVYLLLLNSGVVCPLHLFCFWVYNSFINERKKLEICSSHQLAMLFFISAIGAYKLLFLSRLWFTLGTLY